MIPRFLFPIAQGCLLQPNADELEQRPRFWRQWDGNPSKTGSSLPPKHVDPQLAWTKKSLSFGLDLFFIFLHGVKIKKLKILLGVKMKILK